jgi:hypothetical protein
VPAPALQLVVDLHPVARLYPDARSARPVRVQLGKAVFAAAAECMAGPLAGAPREGVRGQSLARITMPAGDVLVRGISEPGEGQTGLTVELGPPVALYGVVLDAVGVPLAGAELDCDGRLVSSDAEGRFHIDLKYGGAAVPLVARMPGKADTFRLLDLRQAPREPVKIIVAEGAEVRLKVIGPARPGRGEVVVLPGREQDTRLMQYPFWRQADVRTEVSSEGTALVKGLPRGASVRFRLRHDALLCADSEDVRVGERDEAVLLSASAAPMLTGRVLTQKACRSAGPRSRAGAATTDAPLAQPGWILPGNRPARRRELGDQRRRRQLRDRPLACRRPREPREDRGPGYLGTEGAGHRRVRGPEARVPAARAGAGPGPAAARAEPPAARAAVCVLDPGAGPSLRQPRRGRSRAARDPLKEPCLLDVFVELAGPAGWKRSWSALAVMGRTPLRLSDQ